MTVAVGVVTIVGTQVPGAATAVTVAVAGVNGAPPRVPVTVLLTVVPTRAQSCGSWV